MLLIAVVGSLSCGGEEEQPNSYSMIWISLDTTRADHLGIYGYDRDTSPFLDELARRGLFFEWAIAPQNTTLPVHVTMFTGYHPVVHQIMYSKTVNPGVRIGSSVSDHHLVESQVFEDPQSNALYLFRTDPLETTPLTSQAEADAIRARLAEIRSKLEAQSEQLTPTLREFGPVPDPEDKLWEELRALGYIQ